LIDSTALFFSTLIRVQAVFISPWHALSCYNPAPSAREVCFPFAAEPEAEKVPIVVRDSWAPALIPGRSRSTSLHRFIQIERLFPSFATSFSTLNARQRALLPTRRPEVHQVKNRNRNKWPLLAALLVTLSTQFPSPARAGVLWYNGDFDNRDALPNGTAGINFNGGFAEVSKVYDNFVVPAGQTWQITSVFSTDEILYHSGKPVTTASWQILSGVSPGNGGTVVVSGDSAATMTAVAPQAGFTYVDPEFKIVATIPTVTLTAGTYWLSVIPDDTSPDFGDQALVETTSGANAVGTPPGNDGNSFISNNLPAGGPGSDFFTPVSTIEGGGTWDFSMGVGGTATGVPEPSSLALVAIGGIGALTLVRRRKVKGVQ
jgi:hypothetical protein